ncbi:hypothetical protein DACRYDRAFT_113275 [Dacryopinax primogenitus]|uniref:Low temperature requirement protein A n=1 Tax=Dacryopinax primogenitus (strain DJM 731) TaxID=1858805 RepID=M5G8S6_DACPD|nr:uncharacterized protein DACRYDRAFT_113275 [Dacryopinax primogenitus]EJU06611.1 hypothetical protein DACRYDRAFT_113275 [Dacryopinax primogenitus]
MSVTDSTNVEASSSRAVLGHDSHSQPPQEPGHHTTSHGGQHAHHLRYGQLDHIDFDAIADGATNADSELEFERLDAQAARIHRERRYLFRRPRVLQYFKGQTLVRENEERQSGRLELFFDLTFVGLISVLAHDCVENPDGAHVAKYVLTFAPIYMIWTYIRELFNSFWSDDVLQRLLVLFIMICLVIYGNNATDVQFNWNAEGGEGAGRITAIATYLVAGMVTALLYLFYTFFVKSRRVQIRAHFVCWCTVPLSLWIGTIFAPVRVAAALAAIAVFCEYVIWTGAYSQWTKKIFKLKYSSAVAIDHEIERFNDFFTLVMGEFLFSVISRQPAGTGMPSAAWRCVFVVMIAFSFQLLYVHGSGCRTFTHPIRHSNWFAIFWFFLHFPIVAALTLVGDTTYDFVAEDEGVSDGLRWLFSGGYATAMLGIWLLSMLEREKDERGVLWLPKVYRLSFRVISALVTLFLPLAPQDHLTSTCTLAIVGSLSLFTLGWEMVTSLDGPKGPAYQPPDPALHEQRIPVQTYEWRGYPCLAEPGLYVPDMSNQRGGDEEVSPVEEEKRN